MPVIFGNGKQKLTFFLEEANLVCVNVVIHGFRSLNSVPLGLSLNLKKQILMVTMYGYTCTAFWGKV